MIYNVLYWFTFWIFHTIIRLFVRPKNIQGVDSFKDLRGPLILASNHRGRLDGVWIWYYFTKMNRSRLIDMRIITAKKFFYKPILSWYLKKMNCFPVESGKGVEVLKPMVDVLQKDKIVTIFPEGKMQRRAGNRGEAKRGVAYLIWKSKVPVIPIYIDYIKKYKYIPIWEMTFKVGKPKTYDKIKSMDELQSVADDVLELIYKMK